MLLDKSSYCVSASSRSKIYYKFISYTCKWYIELYIEPEVLKTTIKPTRW